MISAGLTVHQDAFGTSGLHSSQTEASQTTRESTMVCAPVLAVPASPGFAREGLDPSRLGALLMGTTPIGLAGATVWPAGKEVRHVDPHQVRTG